MEERNDCIRFLKNHNIKYKKYDVNDEYVEGHNPKAFLRIDDSSDEKKSDESNRTMQDSKLFRHLFDEVKNNPNTSLCTYLNDVIKNGDYPRYVSCMAKNGAEESARWKGVPQTADNGSNASEIIGSRIAEMLEVPTQYSVPVMADDGTVGTILSVDFVSYGEEFDDILSMNRDESYVEMHNATKKWIKAIRSALVAQYPDGIDRESLERLEKVDLPKLLLFRKGGLFADDDFNAYNIGILMKGDKFRLAPSFDMECLLGRLAISPKYYSPNKGIMKDVVSYYGENSPEVLGDFIDKVKEHISDGSMARVIKEYYPNKRIAKNIVANLETNAEMLTMLSLKYTYPVKDR